MTSHMSLTHIPSGCTEGPKNELPKSRLLKVIVLQTERQTDRHIPPKLHTMPLHGWSNIAWLLSWIFLSPVIAEVAFIYDLLNKYTMMTITIIMLVTMCCIHLVFLWPLQCSSSDHVRLHPYVEAHTEPRSRLATLTLLADSLQVPVSKVAKCTKFTAICSI